MLVSTSERLTVFLYILEKNWLNKRRMNGRQQDGVRGCGQPGGGKPRPYHIRHLGEDKPSSLSCPHLLIVCVPGHF